MPLYYTDAKSRINGYHDQLEATKELLNQLINDEETVSKIQKHINAIQGYYNTSLRTAKNEKTQNAIVNSYENYITLLNNAYNIGHQQPTSPDQIEEFFKASNEAIGREYDARRINAFFHNCYNVCELIFWASATITMYASIFLVALPMLIVQPTLGLAVSIAVGGVFLKAAGNCLECLKGFKGTARHSAEYDSERAILSFFQPKEPRESEVPIMHHSDFHGLQDSLVVSH
ncbi:DUF5638 domain-containing protein [Legionella rowbothamii]|uniref:DUF5638 domain-containing protein n=1 Tax=Legionella rowbothamii TaxID=96229 RepID=UPI00105566CE|nr:DUF5638 domain-containing protein [Legionella rowbothamii]